MRKLGLAAAALLTVAALLGAGWLGLAFADARGDAAADRASEAKRTAARKASQPADAWAAGAGRICLRGHEAATRAVERAFTAEGRPRDRVILALLGRSIRISDRVLVRLRRLAPPRSDRASVTRALRLYRKALARDRRTLAYLRREWDEDYLARRIRQDQRLNAQIRLAFLQLGAFPCAQYFDPTTY